MKKAYIPVILLLVALASYGQELYIRSFGEPDQVPLIFVHGGPGYNCANFEVTTAQRMADMGFFVIVYNRRGEGRSPGKNARYTFAEASEDLVSIYKKYGIKKSVLMGHSFGGIVALKFAQHYPGKTSAIILVSAPISLQESFKYILSRSKAIYKAKKDSVNLNYISLIEKMDTCSLSYSSYCFGHAMQNGFYTPKKLTQEAKKLYNRFDTDTILKKYASQIGTEAPQGFWKNETYTTLDLRSAIKDLLSQKIDIFAIYGKEDGLYPLQQVNELKKLLGPDRLKYLEDCSHNVFIDQQSSFISIVRSWMK